MGFIINPYWFVSSTPPGDDLLLNNIPYSAGAWGLRKLDKNYTGSCIKVRESGGDTLADIGFDANGDLDTTALLAHTGGNSGYVHTWYDQSGLGYNGVQTTNGDQPRIVNSGTVDTLNSKPAFYFNGGEKLILDNTGYPNQTSYVGLLVGSFGTSGKVNPTLAGGTTGGYILQRWVDNKLYTRDTAGYFASTSTYTDTDQYLLAGINQESTKNIFRDGDAIEGANLSSSQASVLTTIGQSNSQWSYGYLQEIICYDEDRYIELTKAMSDIGANYRGWSDYSLFSTYFDGVSDYVDLGTGLNSSLELGDSFSISAWVKFGNTATNRNIVSSLGSSAVGIEFRVLTPENIRFILAQGGGNYIYVDSSSISIDTWHHVATTYDGSNTVGGINIYIDGSLDNATNGTSGTLTSITSSDGLTIGARPSGGSTSYVYTGNIDEVAIFDSELSADDVTAIYNSGVPNDITSLSPMAWWRMGDESGISYLLNQMSYSKYSTYFDGVDDLVDLGDSDVLSFGDGSTDSPFSGSMWVYRDNTSNHSFLSKMATSNREWNFYVYSNKLTLALFDESANAYIGRRYNSALVSGAWSHIAFTYNGNGTTGGIKLYLNGSQVDDTNLSSGSYTAMENLTASAKIGHDPVNSLYMEGNIDDVLITSTELSGSDVTDIYNNGKPKDESSRSNLVGYWKMGDNNIFPKIPNEIAYSKKSLLFDGVDDIVQLGEPVAGAGDKTVSMWIKPASITTGDRILSNYDNASIALTIQFAAAAMQIYAGTSGWQSLTTALPSTGSWSHFALVWSGTGSGGGGTVTGYINGGNSATVTLPSDISGERAATFDNISLGAMLYNVFGTTYHGNMDEVSIYDAALSGSDITDIYNKGVPKDESERSNLAAYYKLGDGDYFPIATDSSGNGHNGTIYNEGGAEMIQLDTANGWGTAENETAPEMIQGVTPKGNHGYMDNMGQGAITQDAPT